MKTTKIEPNDRDFVLGCGKLGVLEFNKALYEKFGFTKEEISKLLERDFLELKEGYYTISTKEGVKYHG